MHALRAYPSRVRNAWTKFRDEASQFVANFLGYLDRNEEAHGV
jgi:hypothetical protein